MWRSRHFLNDVTFGLNDRVEFRIDAGKGYIYMRVTHFLRD